MSYILQFIDSARLMTKWLSNIVNSFLEEFLELNVYLEIMIKYVKHGGIKYKYCDCFFECTNFKDDSIE